MTTQTHIETESSLAQAYAQLESIKEMVEAHMAGKGYDGYEFASEAIQDDALSVQVRSGWHVPGDEAEAEEYTILLQAPKSMSSRRGDPCMPAEEKALRVDLRASTVLNAEVEPDGNSATAALEKALRAVALKRFGGPAVRIVGELNQDGEPVTATLEHQHWFTPWTRVDLRASTVLNAEVVMLTYANQFYFGG